MPTLPVVIVTLLLPFEHLFDPRMSRASAKRTTEAVDDRPARVAHFTPALYNIAPVVQQQKSDGSTEPPICRQAIANARAQAILTPGMTLGSPKCRKRRESSYLCPLWRILSDI